MAPETIQETAILGLHQKIAGIIGEANAARPTPTGKNQFGAPAFSIGDVEVLLAPLLAEYRVVIEPSCSALQALDSKVWQVQLDFVVRDADNPEDHFSSQWIDIGSNPAGAASYAAKGFMRRLFHIAEAGEGEEERPPLAVTGGAGKRTAASEAVDAPPTPDGREATPPRPEPPAPTATKGRNVIRLERPAATDTDERAACLEHAIQLVKLGLIPGVSRPKSDGEAITQATKYLDVLSQKNYHQQFNMINPVQVHGIYFFVSSRLRAAAE